MTYNQDLTDKLAQANYRATRVQIRIVFETNNSTDFDIVIIGNKEQVLKLCQEWQKPGVNSLIGFDRVDGDSCHYTLTQYVEISAVLGPYSSFKIMGEITAREVHL